MIFAWYRYCFKKYFSGGGRASRKEYWSFTLINAAIFILFWLISRVVDAPADPAAVGQADALPEDPVLSILFGTLYLIFILAILIPSFAVTMRRLHDRNHSALWILAQFIPVLNLVVLIMLLLPSSPRPNAYGLRAPRTPDDIVPNIAQNIYGPYGQVVYTSDSNNPYEPTRQTTSQGTPMAQQNSGEVQTNNANHRPMKADESGIVSLLKGLSGAKAQEKSPEAAHETVLDEIMKEELPNADTQAGITVEPAADKSNHRPMTPQQSDLVGFLNQISKS